MKVRLVAKHAKVTLKRGGRRVYLRGEVFELHDLRPECITDLETNYGPDPGYVGSGVAPVVKAIEPYHARRGLTRRSPDPRRKAKAKKG